VLRRTAGLAILLGLAAPIAATAQSMMVAPAAVAVDDRTRTASLTLINDGITPVEVTVSSFYGYPVTDSLGRMFLRTFTEGTDTAPSAAGWVESFPRRLHVPPKSRSTVRLLVTPPDTLADGEYWARIVVAARGGRIAVAGAGTAGIEASLALEVRTVVGLFYRHGATATGLVLDNARAAISGDSLSGRVRLTRQGNAAFVGTLRARLLDAAGIARAESALPLGVYYTLEPAFALSTTGLPAGRYRLSLEAVASRPDLPPGTVLAAEPARGTLTIELP
jgi:hypothetical protein